MDQPKSTPDLAALRARLATERGPRFWRSLEELADSEAFQHFVAQEFPSQLPKSNGPDRRTFLKMMAASFALGGLTGCTARDSDREKIVPYVRKPPDVVPGLPRFFASAATLGGFATGIVVESHMERPTKIEGNPIHPASLGGTTAITQAHILGFYDPDRSPAVINLGRISTWSRFVAALDDALDGLDERGSGLRLLTRTVTSPTLATQIEGLLSERPGARWVQYEPINQDNTLAGAQLAFGRPVRPVYMLDQAEVVVALDSNFLIEGPGSVRYAHDFAGRRRLSGDVSEMNRLYSIESSPTPTGATADHRLALRASQIETFARALAAQLGIAGSISTTPTIAAWAEAIADDLEASRGASLVIAGEYQPPAVHALAHAINEALGNVGSTVRYVEPVVARPEDQRAALAGLVDEMARGEVELLVIIDGNPVYDAPADIDFAGALAQVPFRVHMGLYFDETARLCDWHVPESHELESWGDARAYDGTATIIQPLIMPLYDSRSTTQLVAALRGNAIASDYEMVREQWATTLAGDFESAWAEALHDGVIPGSESPTVPVTLAGEATSPPVTSTDAQEGLELIFRPDPTIWDGRFASNGWLQELPKPLTKLTWDNAALMSPATAAALGVENEQRVTLRYREREVVAPVWILVGHPDDAVTLWLGYGREFAGRVGSDLGVNAYRLRTSDAPWFGSGLQVTPAAGEVELATTQHHHSMEGRHLVVSLPLDELLEHPEHLLELREELDPEISLYPEYEYEGYAWGMTIDLTACIGCNACITACQAENNTPVVGKTEVRRGREMHWIRLDRYYEGDVDHQLTHFQPIACVHCELAPCEPVCPVNATVHDHEGLNVMVYNRCVGTRYCSANCPYKVRRFNFFDYADWETESLRPMRNPDVTVRSRGVMEKCTYCVQRINAARYEAEREDRLIQDGEIVTACQQACPTNAIVFGDVSDPDAAVSRLREDQRAYKLLGELNTRPRTSHLARIRNPNPALDGSEE